MIDPCDNCNKPCCYGCEHADHEETEEHIAEKHKKYLVDNIHQAEQIVWWLSYQTEMTDSESATLVRMRDFLMNLRERLQ